MQDLFTHFKSHNAGTIIYPLVETQTHCSDQGSPNKDRSEKVLKKKNGGRFNCVLYAELKLQRYF